MGATPERKSDLPPGELEIVADASAVRSAESGLHFPAPGLMPREAQALIARAPDYTAAAPVLTTPVASERALLPSLPPPVARFGKYDVLGRVAVGGMAEIFLARETLPGGAQRQSALKVIKRTPASAEENRYFEELFLREGRTVVQLAHPHICHVYDIGKQDDHFFIAMEWIEGRSLRDVLARLSERDELTPMALAVGIAAQVASALEHAHNARNARGKRLNVVHRDVNPQNIMLRYDGSVKLVDFGVALVSAEVDSRANTVKGKPSYMAPEQLLNQEVDGRADVFALGVCLHEMLSGLRLHKRPTMRETLSAVLKEPAPSLRLVIPDLPAALDAIVQRALAKQPEQRFESAGELQAALESFLAEQGEVGSPRRIGELMARLYPHAHKGVSVDTSEEATSHFSSFGPKRQGWSSAAGLRSGLLLAAASFLLCGVLWAVYALFSAGAAPAASTKTKVERVLDKAVQPPPSAAEVSPTPPPVLTAPERAPDSPATEAPLETPRPKRRRQSPGFVADPGF